MPMRVVHNDENTANYIKTLDFFNRTDGAVVFSPFQKFLKRFIKTYERKSIQFHLS